ncbi:hypothetical protein ACN42_g1293 [Penicillium freii]|uniref:Uncharacterized protein n=1 Tax=Penicillium freii TaxID=48697 RepID=A0A101MSB7_PENFR|nr:hypothetical protein ACN42_g1293 [Penicillium freii]
MVYIPALWLVDYRYNLPVLGPREDLGTRFSRGADLEPSTWILTRDFHIAICKEKKKLVGFSLIEHVILSAGAMLIFSVYFQLTICPEGRNIYMFSSLWPHFSAESRRQGLQASISYTASLNITLSYLIDITQ